MTIPTTRSWPATPCTTTPRLRWIPRLCAMLDFAAKLTRTPADMSQVDVQRLRNHGLSDEQILSTVLITCTFNFMTRLADSLGVEPPEGRQESHSQWMSEAARGQS